MIKLLAVGLGLVILSPLCAQPVRSQPETFIGLPATVSPSTSAFSRWQQINAQPEETDPELEGMVIKTQAGEEAVLVEEQPEGALDQMIDRMQSLPVRVDYTGVGLIYERSY